MSDDLDAFFDEVDEVAAKAEEEETASAEPPKKKAKPTVVGVVVAAASEKKKTVEEKPKQEEKKVPPPPPPPPSNPATAPIGPLPPAPPAADNKPSKAHVRTAAGKTWVDPTLEEWPENDFRIFVGNIDPTVTDEQVFQHFSRYSSLLKAKVVRDMHKPGQPSRGYAFVSLGDALECAKALRELDQSWLGSRPCRLKRSSWKDRELGNVRKDKKKQKKQQKRMGLL